MSISTNQSSPPDDGSDKINPAGLKKSTDVGGQLVLALESAYSSIRDIYSDGVMVKEYKSKPGKLGHIPEAVIVISSSASKYGHFAHSRWTHNDGKSLAEIMIGAEGLRRSPREVLSTLLHEAVHGICHDAGVQDVSNKGRFHNKAFKRTAEEVGLIVRESNNKSLGHSNTELPEGELQHIIDEITPQLIAHREFDIVTHGGISSNGRELSLRCSCPRKIRVYEGVLNQGLILCAVCGGEFE